MNTSNRYIIPFVVLAIASGLSSCNSNQTRNIDTQTATAATATPNSSLSQIPSMAQLRAKSRIEQPFTAESFTTATATGKTIDLTLYTSDSQCKKLIPNPVSVSANEPATGIVGKIIEQQDTGDFSLTGYRVNVKNGVATVDLRMAKDSKRQIVSLSNCEQFALFGSLRKSLTSNAQLNIKEVRFTEKGKKITL